jgi:BlaI family transcriptional regulator, penicillinase repressor
MTTALPGGELEYAVLVALWELGTASAREVHARVGDPAGLVYTTTAKVLDRLHAKRLVSRERAGKAFIYRPKVKREVLERARAMDLLGRLFGVTPQPAIATLVEAVESLDPELLDELGRAVAARRRSRRGP